MMNFNELYSPISEQFPGLFESLVRILLIVLVIFIMVRLSKRTMQFLKNKELVSEYIIITSEKLLKWLLWLIGGLLILQQIGISIGSIWTIVATLLAMVAVGFVAVWSVLSNLLCSLILVIFKPFSINDEIEVIEPNTTSGLKGRVINFNVMFTTLEECLPETKESCLIQIPNNIFFQKCIRHHQKSGTAVSLEKHIADKISQQDETSRTAT
ncbi:MAG: mechanosensitive ion channel [SAR324 cluster bacterium]|nr:mechanosensitive ion channel [SAR324 cluster bacterium]